MNDKQHSRADALTVLADLLSYAERQICTHENAHRGGAIWEICDACGAKWADDEGGKPEFRWPDEIVAARSFLNGLAVEQHEAAPADSAPDMVERSLRDIARQCARKTTERHSYLPCDNATEQAFEPHAWVLDAMRAAVALDRKMNRAPVTQPAPSAPLEGTGNGADERAAFDYDDVVSICDAHGICLPVDCVEMVVDIVKLSGLLAARAPRTEVAGAVPTRVSFLTEDRKSEIARKCEIECHASPGTNMWQCAYMAIEETINALDEPHLSTWIAEVCEDADGYKHIEPVIEALDDLPKGMKLYSAPQPPSADAAAAPADELAAFKLSEGERDVLRALTKCLDDKMTQSEIQLLIRIANDAPAQADAAAPQAATGQEVAQYQYRLVTPGYEGEWHNCSAEKARTLQDQVYPEGYKVRALCTVESAQVVTRQGLTDAARDVLAERSRQIEQEGLTPAYDDQQRDGSIALAAACYAAADKENYPLAEPPDLWPWDSYWWKPTDERRNLVKAGALILAEIERIDRALLDGDKR